MTGEMALLITVASYGNEYLNGGEEKLNCRRHTSFAYCPSVSFRDSNTEPVHIIARDPNQWFEYLKQNGCKKIRLFYKIQDSNKHSTVLLPKSASWITEAIFADHSDYWTCIWRYHDYVQMDVNQPIINQQASLESIRMNLSEKLEKLYAFAKDISDDKYARLFRANKDILYSREPALSDYYHDLIVSKNYSLSARQVLYAAVSSWCFTGMGSWSDNCVFPSEENDRKEELTRELFLAVCDAIMYSINSY